MSISASSERQLKRLRWRCRRGTRELDALLGGWMDEDAAGANDATISAFEELLEQPDPLIWDWLMDQAKPTRADWKEIIDAIRARNRL